MLFINRDALNRRTNEVPAQPQPVKTTLYVEPVQRNGNFLTIVRDEEGEILFSSTLEPDSDTMLVTDYRTKQIKREQISMSNTLEESARDMRELGYIGENDVLAWESTRTNGATLAQPDETDEDEVPNVPVIGIVFFG